MERNRQREAEGVKFEIVDGLYRQKIGDITFIQIRFYWKSQTCDITEF